MSGIRIRVFSRSYLGVRTRSENSQPNIPSNPRPGNGTIDVSLSPSLGWDGGDPDEDNIVMYEIYFGTSPDPPLKAPSGRILGTSSH